MNHHSRRILLLLISTFGAVAKLHSADSAILSLKISKLDIEDAPLEGAVKSTLAAFAAEHPDEKSFHYVITSKLPRDSVRIKLHLKDIPLAMALSYIAYTGSYAWNLSGHIILLSDLELGRNKVTRYPVFLDDAFRKRLSLPDAIGPADFEKMAKLLKLNGAKIQFLSYSSEAKALLVEGRISEIELLIAANEFMKRGLYIDSTN